MAKTDAAEAALLEAIEKVAKAVTTTSVGSHTAIARYAASARDLAEAHAWLRSPNQSHGGSTAGE